VKKVDKPKKEKQVIFTGMLILSMLCSTINIHSMERHSLLTRHNAIQEFEQEKNRLNQCPSDVTSWMPLSADIVRNGKIAAKYLTYTALPQLVAGIIPDGTPQRGSAGVCFDDPVTCVVASVAFVVCAVGLTHCVKWADEAGQKRLAAARSSSNLESSIKHLTTTTNHKKRKRTKNKKKKSAQGRKSLTLTETWDVMQGAGYGTDAYVGDEACKARIAE
jgi:hypothetical protein